MEKRRKGEGARLLIVDDSDLYSDCLKVELEEDFGFRVIGQAYDGSEAIALALELRPDIALIDLNLPKVSGAEVLSRLRSELPETRLIAMSMHSAEEVGAKVSRAGADAYFEKESTIEALVRQIELLEDHSAAVGSGSDQLPR